MTVEGQILDPNAIHRFSRQRERPLYYPIISGLIEVAPHLAHRTYIIDPESVHALQKGGCLLVAAPHRSHADYLFIEDFLSRYTNALVPTVAADYWDLGKPVNSALSHKFDFIPVERGGKESPEGLQVAVLNDIGDIISNGWNALMFPAASRKAKNPFKFKKGAAALLEEHDMLIIPIGLAGIDKILSASRRLPSIGGSVVISVGRPIANDGILQYFNRVAKVTEVTDRNKMNLITQYIADKTRQAYEQARGVRCENRGGLLPRRIGASVIIKRTV